MVLMQIQLALASLLTFRLNISLFVMSLELWQTVQIQISWLLQKPTDLDLQCLQRQGISGFSRTRIKAKYIFGN